MEIRKIGIPLITTCAKCGKKFRHGDSELPNPNTLYYCSMNCYHAS